MNARRLLIASVLMACLWSDAVSTEPPAGKFVNFQQGPFPRGTERYRTYHMRGEKDDDGVTFGVANASLCYIRAKYDLGRDGYLLYPCKPGQIVAVFSGLYVVSSAGETSTSLQWDPKIYPKTLSIQEDSIAIPLQLKNVGGGMMHDSWVKVSSITEEKKGGAEVPVARIHFVDASNGKEYLAEIRKGDIVLLNGRGHQVRSIVPRVAKTKVSGWVELAPQPIPEADLIRDKTPFVRPALKVEDKGAGK
jgi:hypothetical protein